MARKRCGGATDRIPHRREPLAISQERASING